MNIQIVTLNTLRLSTMNVRKTEKDAFIESLADDIATRGLKQNLVVCESADADHYEVVAGGRRFQAMSLLVTRNVIPADHPVTVLIEPREEGVETSLSENLHRVAMNPADEFLAFQTVIDQLDGSPDDRIIVCARRFGATESHVRGRLRLAGLSETILDALRTNVIGIGAAMAYASFDDNERQDAVFATQCKSNWKPHDPDAIRSAMRDKTYSLTEPKVIFLGMKLYREAGGRTDIDMFTLDATERLIDTKIIDDLFKVALAAALPKMAKKLKIEGLVFTTGSYTGGKEPQGWKAVSEYGSTEDRDKRIAGKEPTMASVYLTQAGKLELTSGYFIPRDPNEVEEVRAPYVQKTPEEHAADRRRDQVEQEAFRLAFPVCAGTPMEGRLYMATFGRHMRIEEVGDDFYANVQVRISRAEMEAQMAAAEASFDEKTAAHEAAMLAAKEASESLKAAAIETPPAAVLTAGRNGTAYFQQEDGTYLDGPESDEGYETIADLISNEDLVKCWTSIEAYRIDYPEAADAADAE